MKVYYFAAFIPQAQGKYSIILPDLGITVKSKTLPECMEIAKTALKNDLRKRADAGAKIPSASTLCDAKEKLTAYLAEHPHEIADEILYQLIPAPSMDFSLIRISVSLPKAVLADIDEKAEMYGYTRSSLLAEAAEAYTPKSLSKPHISASPGKSSDERPKPKRATLVKKK